MRIDNLLSMFLRPDFECLQQLVNFILDRLIMRALVARRTAPQGPLFRAQSRKSVVHFVCRFQSGRGSPALSMKTMPLRAGTTKNPLENEDLTDDWRRWIIESAGETPPGLLLTIRAIRAFRAWGSPADREVGGVADEIGCLPSQAITQVACSRSPNTGKPSPHCDG